MGKEMGQRRPGRGKLGVKHRSFLQLGVFVSAFLVSILLFPGSTPSLAKFHPKADPIVVVKRQKFLTLKLIPPKSLSSWVGGRGSPWVGGGTPPSPVLKKSQGGYRVDPLTTRIFSKPQHIHVRGSKPNCCALNVCLACSFHPNTAWPCLALFSVWAQGSKCKVVAVEPAESPVMSGGKPSPHGIQGAPSLLVC